MFGRIDKEANKFEQKLTLQTDKYLNKLQKQEEKLQRKLWRTDSTKAKEVFGDVFRLLVSKHERLYKTHLNEIIF